MTASLHHPIQLACPDCGRELTVAAPDELRCGACQATKAACIDGVLCFTDPQYYWGEIPREQMEQANRLANELGWQAAVDQVVADPSLRQYICDPRRADFQYIWDLPPEAAILDVGAGWGAIASALGRNFGCVVAVEGVLERARFIRTRVEQMGQRSVQVIASDFLRLPLAAGQFDAVVLNGVLEWSALTSAGDPRQVQLRFLRRIRELLKPSGFICVGIENRIGWAMLRGGTDHSGLRYTSLLPRRLADWWCRFYGRRYRSDANAAYRTYTYSLPGYRKLFRDAGFGRVQAFQPWEGYNLPATLLPLETPQPLLHFLSRTYHPTTARGRLKRLALKASAHTGLWARFASDYVFLVQKS